MGGLTQLRLVHTFLTPGQIKSKVFLSLLTATIAAFSVGLYVIWESRRRRRQPTKTKGDRVRSLGGYPESCADTHDVGANSSETNTSIDPHQSNGSDSCSAARGQHIQITLQIT